MFFGRLKNIFNISIIATTHKNEFTSSQKQAVMKLIEKKYRDKRRLIYLLNNDYNTVSKASVARHKNYFIF